MLAIFVVLAMFAMLVMSVNAAPHQTAVRGRIVSDSGDSSVDNLDFAP